MFDFPVEVLKLVIVGHVDHGKSTLVGRLLNDTHSLPPGKADSIRAMCERRGMPFEWSFLMDSLQAERDQGITIDTTQIWLRTSGRETVIIDAPGHKEFLKNMITGAAQADAALLVIDAKEGVREQSRRHGYLLHLLGVRQILVVVNKMDVVDYSRERFFQIGEEIGDYFASLRMPTPEIVPIAARDGDNIVERSGWMSWYSGPTVIEMLSSFHAAAAPTEQPLRLPIQDIYKFDEKRILVGRIESGSLRVGDQLIFSPQNRVARVASIEAWNAAEPERTASAGQSIALTLDDQLFVERGALASHLDSPPIETDVFRARIFWLGHKPLQVGQIMKMKMLTAVNSLVVQSIECVIDTDDLSSSKRHVVERNSIAEVTLRTESVVALDDYSRGSRAGRFVLVDEYDIVAGGIVFMDGYADQRSFFTTRAANIQRVEHRVSQSDREQRNGHKAGVLWLTGLSGAGKSTLAIELERQLFARGYQVYTLDGDNLRFGLNVDLGFTPEHRAENIRRVGEVAALFAESGIIVLSAFISPYRADRDRARKAARGEFHEIYVRAELVTCEQRDPKGLYRKARAGEILGFTGVDAPYEVPEKPDLVVDTDSRSVEDCVRSMLAYVERYFPRRTDH
jgi:bifunctional enzyme CysN/CysC